MKKIVDGVIFYRRPPSSACPRGAWMSDHYHTHYSARWGMWIGYETGIGEVVSDSSVKRVRGILATLEKRKKGIK